LSGGSNRVYDALIVSGSGRGYVGAAALEEAIRAIPAECFRASPFIYWCDFLASAATGWIAFGVAVRSPGGVRIALLVLATIALYRAVLFIHEITHRAARDVPYFKLAWNILVGVPLLIPSFLYEGVHLDHHRQRCYGTAADPEYVPYGRRRPQVILASVAASLLAPVAFAARFALAAPVAWIVPSLRRVVGERASALVINTEYRRRAPLDADARLQEAAACALVWIVGCGWWAGFVPTVAVVCWASVTASASFVNALRTLAAHRYDHDEDELEMVEQLLDSCTIAPRRGSAASIADLGRVLVAPVGLRYHALHHWIPSVPYNNLGEVHRRLVATIAPAAPYRATFASGFSAAIRDLVHRSRTQTRSHMHRSDG
jgi:fatty acid desaturase